MRRRLFAAPVCAGGLLALTLCTSPASADGGWWYAGGNRARAYFKDAGDVVTVCDLKKDGEKGAVRIETDNEAFVDIQVDNYADGKCTSLGAAQGADLYEDNWYRFSVCTQYEGTLYSCGPWHRTYNG